MVCFKDFGSLILFGGNGQEISKKMHGWSIYEI